MRVTPIVVITAALAVACSSTAAAGAQLSQADTVAAFKAAGYQLKGRKWMACAEGKVEDVRDVNGDGLPDVLITEEGTECHGMTGQGYSLVSKQPNGSWKEMSGGTGVPMFLPTKGAAGWPDLQVGGPGFCFPVLRWNGRDYALQRHEYEGKRCKPQR